MRFWKSQLALFSARALKVCLLLIVLAFANIAVNIQAQLAFQTLYKFFPSNQISIYPTARLAQGKDGSFYGTTVGSSTASYGTIFRFSSAGVLTNLFSFSLTNGYGPQGLLTGDDGYFYGTTVGGSSYGTIFQTSTNGSLTILHSFTETDGVSPVGGLTKGSDGRLYGLTRQGGDHGLGTVFALDTNGLLSSLISFNGANGCNPIFGGLLEGRDGNFYGTTTYGGTNFAGQFTGLGTLFRITTNGVLSTLVYFSGTNGSNPYGGLAVGSDGSFYGTTRSGGSYGLGTIFRITADGTLTNLLSFNGTNGARPSGDIAQAADGTFYGLATARLEGTNWTYGTVFNFNTNGSINTLFSFDGTTGRNSFAGLTSGADDNLYGTMIDEMKKSNTDGSGGSIFRLAQRPRISSVMQSNGAVTLSWTSFTNGVYRVEFKPNLGAADWSISTSGIPATTTSSSVILPLGGVTERYWRVVLSP
jgi:uncharacterized repeat protein (TIGR03803 family)